MIKKNYFGTDKNGKKWYIKNGKNGSQYWVWTYKGKFGDGGYNRSPRDWNPETGLCASAPKNINVLKKHGGK